MTHPEYLADERRQAEAVSAAKKNKSLKNDHIRFLQKWRLNRLVAPGLPDPQDLLIGLPDASQVPPHLRSHTVTLSIPDFIRCPARTRPASPYPINM